MRAVRMAVVVAVLPLAGCSGGALREAAGASSTRGSVKIGFIAPLSGPFASGGEDIRRGFRFYLDRHEGRLGGREVAVVEVDDGAGPETGVPAIRRSGDPAVRRSGGPAVRRLLTRDRVVAAAGIVNSAVALGAHQSFIDARRRAPPPRRRASLRGRAADAGRSSTASARRA